MNALATAIAAAGLLVGAPGCRGGEGGVETAAPPVDVASATPGSAPAPAEVRAPADPEVPGLDAGAHDARSSDEPALPEAAAPASSTEAMKWYATTFAPGHTSSCWIDPEGHIRCKGSDCCALNGGTRTRVPDRYATTRFRALALTHLTACGVFEAPVAGRWLDCWGGLGENAASAARPSAADVAQIGLGDSHACLRQSDGAVKCWGQATADTPAALRAKFLAVGPSMNCAIGQDDGVVCWGPRPAPPPPGLRAKYLAVFAEQEPVDARQAVARRAYACAVTLDDGLRCWGDVSSPVLRPPAGLRARSVSLGIRFGCAVRLDGTGVCWGSGAPVELGPVKQVAANFWLACALGLDDRVRCISGDAYREPPAGTQVAAPW